MSSAACVGPLEGCPKQAEFSNLHSDFMALDDKMDQVIAGQNEIKTEVAVVREQHSNTVECLKRYGNKLDDHDKEFKRLTGKFMDIEAKVRENSDARTKLQVWIERLGFLAIAAYFGWDDIQ